MSIKVGILDVGYGNIGSLKSWFEQLHLRTEMVSEANQVAKNDILILPGVGSFKFGIESVRNKNLDHAIISRHMENAPILGICLGFQILSLQSEESIESRGLGIFELNFQKMRQGVCGWRSVRKYDSCQDKEFFFFNHNYGAYLGKKHSNAWLTDDKNVALMRIQNTVGVQFHPEKSQTEGEKFFRKLVKSWL